MSHAFIHSTALKQSKKISKNFDFLFLNFLGPTVVHLGPNPYQSQ